MRFIPAAQVIKVYVRGEKDQFPDGGKMSQYLNSLVVGKSTVDIKGPIGRLQYMGKGRFMLGKKYLPVKKQIGMMAVRPKSPPTQTWGLGPGSFLKSLLVCLACPYP